MNPGGNEPGGNCEPGVMTTTLFVVGEVVGRGGGGLDAPVGGGVSEAPSGGLDDMARYGKNE